MKTVFKYPLKFTGIQDVEMPQTASILSVQLQNGTICLWAIVDPAKPPELRKIAIYGTGHFVDSHNLQFIGTVQDREFVWHVF